MFIFVALFSSLRPPVPGVLASEVDIDGDVAVERSWMASEWREKGKKREEEEAGKESLARRMASERLRELLEGSGRL